MYFHGTNLWQNYKFPTILYRLIENILFNYESLQLLLFALVLVLISIQLKFIFRFKHHEKLSILLLTGASLIIGYWAASQDDFFNVWDEQYHALVAKSLTENPFFPKLLPYPVVDYDFKNWSNNYVWVHKQPLFLWLMALSIKLFGFSELSVRLPSIIARALVTPIIYKIGKNHFGGNVPYYAAMLFTVSYYSLELVSGRLYTDHNDLMFMFFVTASFWAFSEYTQKQKPRWLALMALFSGFAVLVKWLVGLLVYLAFFVYEMPQLKTYVENPRKILLPLFAFSLTVSVFLPWQIYILYRFPTEASHELKTAALHFSEVIEGHEGEWYFHFIKMKELLLPHNYYWLLWIILPLTFIWEVLTKDSENDKRFFIVLFSIITFVYLFFTFAKSKLPGFCFVISPLAYMVLALFTDKVAILASQVIKRKKENTILLTAYSFLLILMFSNYKLFLQYHNDSGYSAKARLQRKTEKKAAQWLAKELQNRKVALFNFGFEHTSAAHGMLYMDNPCFYLYPTQQQVEQVLKNGYELLVLQDSLTPDFIKQDKRILLLNKNDYF